MRGKGQDAGPKPPGAALADEESEDPDVAPVHAVEIADGDVPRAGRPGHGIDRAEDLHGVGNAISSSEAVILSGTGRGILEEGVLELDETGLEELLLVGLQVAFAPVLSGSRMSISRRANARFSPAPVPGDPP